MFMSTPSSDTQNPSVPVLDAHPYLRQSLDLVADKWVSAVLFVLSTGTRRYSQLQREIGTISQRMLTSTLRHLERNGLVHRQIYPVVPPRVEYSLTPLGQTLNSVLKALCDWSRENFQAVEQARQHYEQSNPENEL